MKFLCGDGRDCLPLYKNERKERFIFDLLQMIDFQTLTKKMVKALLSAIDGYALVGALSHCHNKVLP